VKEQFSKLREVVSSNSVDNVSISDSIQSLKDIEKALTIAEFKLARCSREKYAISKLLEETIEELQVKTQVLIRAGKMAALGQLVAGVAHEVNSPLGAISSSVCNIIDAQNDTMNLLPQLIKIISEDQIKLFLQFVNSVATDSHSLSSREERKLRKQFAAKLEKWKIENPGKVANKLVYMGVLKLREKYLPLLKSENAEIILETANSICNQRKNSENIKLAVDKASRIVFALKMYGRQSEVEEKTKTDVIANVETILTLYNNQLKQGVDVIRNFQIVPKTMAFDEELGQVWTNIIHNAIQAMKNSGTLTIDISKEEDSIIVKISDSGIGIPREAVDRIFEPFYTTKAIGEGSGLGLDIVRKIVDKHNGEISVHSVLGEGTSFRVALPIVKIN
jgi:two-component system, NtrC family, sensor kinase